MQNIRFTKCDYILENFLVYNIMKLITILIVILAVIFLYLILRYAFYDPYTLQMMKNAKTMSVISPSSLATNGTSFKQTNFAYSIWFYINDWNYRYGNSKVIFGRMGSTSGNKGSVKGINGIDPCPVVSLGSVENNVDISLSCYSGNTTDTKKQRNITHTCTVTNIPIQKWVNLTISVYGRTLDVYLNGKLVKTCLLPGVANVSSNSDLYVTPNGGFDGWTSRFQYYPNSLNPQDAWNIYYKGFDSKMSLIGKYNVKLSLSQNGISQGEISI